MTTDNLNASHLPHISKVIQHAIAVFDDESKVEHWLNAPIAALKGEKPITLLGTSEGFDHVNIILSRIEKGVYT